MRIQVLRSRRAALSALLLPATLALASACGILDEGEPARARVVIEGADGHPIRLVTTDDFVILAEEGGENREVYVHSADTSVVASPFDHRYSLGPKKRFYLSASSDEVPPEPVSVRVYIDRDLRYDRETLFDGEALEFVYTVW